MEANKGSTLTPDFSAKDIETLKRYFEYNKKYYDKVNQDLTAELSKHPLWGPILQMQTPEQLKAQNERSLELQRAAIFDGKWEDYAHDLIGQGQMYARMNVSYADWYGIVKLYKDYLLPYIRKDFANDLDGALTYIDGLGKFIDFAMYGIAEAYFREKNEMIRATEALFSSIVNSSDDAIYSKNFDECVTSWNYGAEKMYGFKAKEILGKHLSEIIPEELLEEEIEISRKVKKGESIDHYETERKRKDGKMIFVSLTISPIKDADGKIVGASKIARDITERRKQEEQIKKLNEELEQKVLERTEQLTSVNKELESFTYSVSHDLRAPLRAVSGYATMVAEDYEKQLDAEGKRLLNVIQHNAKMMGMLIDDLLAFSRLGRQEIKKSSVDMNELFLLVRHEVLSDAAENYVSKATQIKFADLNEVQADYNLIKHVVTNLLSNAVKYSSKNDKPLIEVSSEQKNGDIIFRVKDNGVGFDQNYAHKLFGVFQRLHSNDEFEGTGVGLAIVQRIIHKHGGKVWAEGKVGEGASFYFSLPAK